MTDIPDDLDDAQALVVDGDVKRISQLEADDRGRINLGSEYADETVRVAGHLNSDAVDVLLNDLDCEQKESSRH